MIHTLDNGTTLQGDTGPEGTFFQGSSTGTHSIAVSSEERIQAHWKGYVQAAERAYQIHYFGYCVGGG